MENLFHLDDPQFSLLISGSESEGDRGRNFVLEKWYKVTVCSVLLRPRFLLFFFLRTWTVISHGFTVYVLFNTVHTLFNTVHVLKNIKNRSHDTIYTFKNYFATVFSVFSFKFSATISSIQTDPKCMRNWLHLNMILKW